MNTQSEESTEIIERPGFDRAMSRDEINALPMGGYDGPVHLVRSPEECGAALEALAGEPVLGFDTETRPAFRKGESYLPSLVQLAGREAVYLFQLRTLGFGDGLMRLLADERVVKAGVAVKRDVLDLQQLAPFEAAGFLDLGDIAKANGIHNHGLRGLCAVFLGFRISKSAQRSNWARAEYTDKMVRYAATDAWLGLELYHRFKKRGYL